MQTASTHRLGCARYDTEGNTGLHEVLFPRPPLREGTATRGCCRWLLEGAFASVNRP